jgi:hypothetical protein
MIERLRDPLDHTIAAIGSMPVSGLTASPFVNAIAKYNRRFCGCLTITGGPQPADRFR